MFKVVGSKNCIVERRHKISRLLLVYVISIIFSILLIIFSWLPGGIKEAETILVSIGCSGFTAAFMAIFIDMAQKEDNKKNNGILRRIYLNELHQQLKKLLERLIWFDSVISDIKLDKNTEYYMTLEFYKEVHKLNYYECLSYEEVEKRIKELIVKYEKSTWKNTNNLEWNKVSKMFRIIGMASSLLKEEVNKLEANKIFLLVNEILTEEDFRDILTYTKYFDDFLTLEATNYTTSIQFLFDGYCKLRHLCGYEDDFYIWWQTRYDIQKMVIEDRRIKQNKHTIKHGRKRK